MNRTSSDFHEPPRIIFSGGGTGGHIYPGLALAEWISANRPGSAVAFLATSRPIDRKLLSEKSCGVCSATHLPTVGAPPISRPWRWLGFFFSLRHSLRLARRRVEQFCPDVVVGLGGYGSYPAVRVAQDKGIATVVLNPDLIVGRANRRLLRRASAVCCQFAETVRAVGSGVKAHLTGCPLRAALFSFNRGEAKGRAGISPHKRTLLVTGASLGARNINHAVVALLPHLAKYRDEWQIVHLTGSADYDFVHKEYEGSALDALVEAYRDDMGLVYAASDLVLSRAGAGMVAEITALGLPAVFMPYPYHRDRHQERQARVVEAAGAAVVVNDCAEASGNAAALWPHLDALLSDPARLAKMAEASRAIGRPDATARVGEIILGLADAAIERRLSALRVDSASKLA